MDDITSTTPGLTVEAYASRKGFDVAQLARWGVVTVPNPYTEDEPTPCLALPYRDLDGNLIRTKYRVATTTFWCKGAAGLTLYGLWWLPRVPVHRPVLLVEGESDCHACWSHGVLALGLPGSSTWRSEWTPLLDGRQVYVWKEPILPGKKVDAGRKMCEAIAVDLPTAKVIQPQGVKDVAELHLKAGDGFSSELRALMDAAQPITDVVIAKPVQPAVRVYRVPQKRHPMDRDTLDVERAKLFPLAQLMQEAGFDLKRRGKEWAIRCPLHDDKDPSLRINTAKNLWWCDVCGVGGDGIAFLQKWKGLSFPDAVRAVVA